MQHLRADRRQQPARRDVSKRESPLRAGLLCRSHHRRKPAGVRTPATAALVLRDTTLSCIREERDGKRNRQDLQDYQDEENKNRQRRLMLLLFSCKSCQSCLYIFFESLILSSSSARQ